MIRLSQEKRNFYERLKYTILDSTRDELDEILRTLIRKDNARDFYNELFDNCHIDKAGEIVRHGFFEIGGVSVPLEYAMYTLLAYAPADFPLKKEIRSIRFIAPAGRERQVLRFPRRLDYLPNLEQLGVVGWASASVPKELARCRKLKFLSLRDNNFSSIPDAVLAIPHLTYLDMSLNQITSLPAGLNRLKKLKTLSLKGNLIARVPASINELPGLESLDLSCNRVSSIPLEYQQLKVQIDVSYNDLSVEEEVRWEASLPSK